MEIITISGLKSKYVPPKTQNSKSGSDLLRLKQIPSFEAIFGKNYKKIN